MRGHARAGDGARDFAYRQGAARVRERKLGTPRRSDGASEPRARRIPRQRASRIHNAREHNLKNIDVEIPRERFTVITGVSGSGKSTLAFDILFNEGQRRYLESLNAYARQFVQAASRPDVDAIFGIPPTVAIEQRTSRGGRKSTVGTLTEIHHFLRLLFVKLGTQYCPRLRRADRAAERGRDRRAPHEGVPRQAASRCSRRWSSNRKGFYTDLAKWALGKGYWHLRVDGKLLPTRPFPRLDRFKEHTIELPVAEVEVDAEERERSCARRCSTRSTSARAWCTCCGTKEVQVFSTKRACRSCGRSFPELDPRLFSYNSKHGWCAACYGTGLQIDEVEWDDERSKTGAEDHVLDSWIEWLEIDEACPECEGKRLNPEALAVRLRGKNIADYARAADLAVLQTFFEKTRARRPRAGDRARHRSPSCARAWASSSEVGPRLSHARPLGADALGRRGAAHPAGGPAGLQPARRLLHPRRADHRPAPRATTRSCSTRSRSSSAKGNTLVVVEHDEDTIRRAAPRDRPRPRRRQARRRSRRRRATPRS